MPANDQSKEPKEYARVRMHGDGRRELATKRPRHVCVIGTLREVVSTPSLTFEYTNEHNQVIKSASTTINITVHRRRRLATTTRRRAWPMPTSPQAFVVDTPTIHIV